MKTQSATSAASEELKPQEEPKPQIGRYSIERLLARGGMAEVFVGRASGPAGFSKRVVIKRILPDLAQNETFISMFLNEARLAALLEHPSIVQVFDFGEHSSTYYIAMEYVEGESLRSILKYYEANKQAVPLAPVLVWMQSVCEGLDYAHRLTADDGQSYNIVHRDVSPENILISKSGLAKVVDFGVAKASSMQRELTSAGVVKGKFSYIAPEQILGQPIDQRADVYSLGVTLYEVLVGRRPHVADNELTLLRSIIETDPVPPHEVRPDIDSKLSGIICRAIARNPELRYPDMLTLNGEIDDYLKARGLRVKSSELSGIVAQVSRWTAERWPSNCPSRPQPSSSSVSSGKLWRPPALETVPGVDDVEFELIPEEPDPAPSSDIASSVDSDAAFERAMSRARKSLVRSKLKRRALFALLLVVVAGGGFVALRQRSSPGTAVAPATEPSRSATAASLPRPEPAPSPSVPPVSATAPEKATTLPAPAAAPQHDLATAGTRPADTLPKPPAVAARPPPQPARHRPVPEPAAAPKHRMAFAGTRPTDTLARPPAVAARPPLPLPLPPPEPAPVASLSPSVDTGDGWLNLRTEPWCEVFLKGERLGTTPLNRLAIPVGRYSLRLVNKEAGIDRVIQVEIRPGEVSTTRLRLAPE
jgi:serine/threonine-protein kinase